MMIITKNDDKDAQRTMRRKKSVILFNKLNEVKFA